MLQQLLKTFEKNKNKENYNKICNYLDNLVKKKKNYKCYLTDDNGVLIYHSKEKNSWKRYNSGEIKYHSVKEANISNLTEKRKKIILLDENKITVSVKLGSTFTQVKNFANTPLGEAIGITTILAFVFAGSYFAFKDMAKKFISENIEIFFDEASDKKQILFENPMFQTIYENFMSGNNSEDFMDKDFFENFMDEDFFSDLS